MKKILITGASGFTGSHLARKMKEAGYQVRALVRPGRDASFLEKIGAKIVRGDVTQKETLVPAVQGVETVYHLAAVYRQEGIPKKVFWEVNVEGTRNLLEVSREAKVKRFVHCSTVGVQGEIKNPPATEEAPYNPGDHYQTSKMEGEKVALSYFREGRLPGVVFRPVGIYGPGDLRFLKLFRNVKKPMIGSGKVLYHLTYIDDLVEGIRLVGETPGIEGEIFTLAGPRYTTLNELYTILAEILGTRPSRIHLPVWPFLVLGTLCEWICTPFRIQPPIYRRRLDFFLKDRAFDISKAKNRLGYSPKVDLKEGLTKTALWYKEKGLLSF